MLLILIVQLQLYGVVKALNTDAFQSSKWIPATDEPLDKNHHLTFTVALHLRDRDLLKSTFHSVSDPRSSSYGQYRTAQQLSDQFAPRSEDLQHVVHFFQNLVSVSSASSSDADTTAAVETNLKGDMLRVTASVDAIEKYLGTALQWHRHATTTTTKRGHPHKRSVRAVKPLQNIPDTVASHIAFVSLNAPVNHMKPRNHKSSRSNDSKAATGSVSARAGNKEALITFIPICGDGLPNTANPPCTTQATPEDVPSFTVYVTEYSNNVSDPYWLTTDPMEFHLLEDFIFCYNNNTLAACAGAAQEGTCYCTAKIAPLPMYTQLRFNVTSTLPTTPPVTTVIGTSSLTYLTDVATVSLLSSLYNIPAGQSVHSMNATQGVAEFYGEYYSNRDLAAFLALSGLRNASIPPANVLYGTNDEEDPGGEAQLDVEYLMGLAPGAPTYFYSIDTFNPYSSENEGFLTWLYYVGNETHPPLVQSLSYGDVEADVFPTDNQNAYDYGLRCDEEFMLLGLQGISILVSSGDDGIGSIPASDGDPDGCQQAWPEWPTSSPYVTSIGATTLTNTYLPVCFEEYSSGLVGEPAVNKLNVQCTGSRETVCSSTVGGVITSGGGFSDVSDREETAPWQVSAVNKYLAQSWAQPSTPGYYNRSGRAYPDVATYGSNYFVYLDGSITRESGTSASAPVFSAMVTLWNDIRFEYGMPPMGFVAPFLYYVAESNPEAFNDIVTGDNACTAGKSVEDVTCCAESFAATPGWDAVTGLGSPNFNVLASLVINNATQFGAMGAYPDGGAMSSSSSSNSNSGVNEDSSSTFDGAYKGMIIAALVVSVVSLLAVVYAVVRLQTASRAADAVKQSLVDAAHTQ